MDRTIGKFYRNKVGSSGLRAVLAAWRTAHDQPQERWRIIFIGVQLSH
jgi:hypothetical protein